MWNLIRWVSPRTIKETFVPPTDYRYPFLGPDRGASRLSAGSTRGDDRLERGPAAGERLDVGDRADEQLLVPGVLPQVVRDEVERHALSYRPPRKRRSWRCKK